MSHITDSAIPNTVITTVHGKGRLISSGSSSSPSSSSFQPNQLSATSSLIDSTRQLLQSSSMSATTIAAYSTAVRRFLDYCHSQPIHHRHRFPHPTAVQELDFCLQQFICVLFIHYAGRNKQLAVNAVYGIYFINPEFRGLLKRSEQLLQGWGRLKPSISHPPLTWPLATLIAVTFAVNNHIDAALATLVSFDGLLRIGEMVNIKISDVSTLQDSRRGTTAATALSSTASHPLHQQPSLSSTRVCIRLAKTKTGKNQWCELFNNDLGILITKFVANKDPNEYLFNFPSSRPADNYRQSLKLVLDGLGLTQSHYSPHSLRHGGATHAHIHLNQSIEVIMHRGRWQSNNTCRSYIQSGNAALLTQQLPSRVVALASSSESLWVSIIEPLILVSSE